MIRRDMSRNSRRQKALEFMDRLGVGAIVLKSPANFAWYTGGANNRVNYSAPLGAALVLLTPDDEFVVTNNIEFERMREEQVQDMEVVQHPWYEGAEALIRDLSEGRTLGADFAMEGARNISSDIAPLRHVLDTEATRRYGQVGKRTAEAIREAAEFLRPGMDEREAEASLVYCCTRRGLSVPVALVAADERIARYRHPVSHGEKPHRRIMLAVSAEQYGLHASLTLFVHFEKPGEKFERRQTACEGILSRMREEATKPGRSLAEAFADCRGFYAEAGFPDEWRLHHQGGIAGYTSREVIASPQTPQSIEEGQAFAWNPSITGAKAEETFVLTGEGPEVVASVSDAEAAG
jgi:Xaa-Pro dipeptidase